MNGQSAQQENPTILAKPSSNLFNNKTFIYVMILLSGFFLGFITWSTLPFGKLSISPTSISPKPTINESMSPISVSFLTNPIVYQWRGSVEGILTDKNKTAFTITKAGNSIIIPIDSIMTKFFGTIKEDRTRDDLKLEDIPAGTFVRGEFWTVPGKKDEIIGGQFYLDNEVKKQ